MVSCTQRSTDPHAPPRRRVRTTGTGRSASQLPQRLQERRHVLPCQQADDMAVGVHDRQLMHAGALHGLQGLPDVGVGRDRPDAIERHHDRGGRRRGPGVARHFHEAMQRQQADGARPVGHEERALAGAADVLVGELLQGGGARDHRHVRRHHLRHRMAGEPPLHRLLAHLRGRGAVEEPADERDPEPVGDPPPDDLPGAVQDEQQREPAADGGRHPGRPPHVARHRPDDRAEDPSPVEGEARNEVEERQRAVDEREVLEQPEQRSAATDEGLQQLEQRREREADDGTGQRHEELGQRARGIGGNLRDAAEDEQRDAAHRDPEAHGDDRVAQLVQQHADEQHHGRQRPHRPVEGRRPPGELRRIVAGRHHPGDEGEDQEPGVIEADRDTEYAAEGDLLAAHLYSGLRPDPRLTSLARVTARSVPFAPFDHAQGAPSVSRGGPAVRAAGRCSSGLPGCRRRHARGAAGSIIPGRAA